MKQTKSKQSDRAVRKVRTLSREALIEIVEYARDGLYLDMDARGREFYSLDKPVSGADYIDHVVLVLEKHGLVPEESNDEEGQA